MNFEQEEMIYEQDSDIIYEDNDKFEESQIKPKNLNINQVEQLLGLEISKIENQYQVMYQKAVKDLEEKFRNQYNINQQCENCDENNKLKQKNNGKKYWKQFYEKEFQDCIIQQDKKYKEKLNEINRMKSLLSIRMKKLSEQRKIAQNSDKKDYQGNIDIKNNEISELKKQKQNLQNQVKNQKLKIEQMENKIEDLEFNIQELQTQQQNEEIIQSQLQKQNKNSILEEVIQEQKNINSESDDEILLLPVQYNEEQQATKKKIKIKKSNSKYQKVLNKSYNIEQSKKKLSNNNYLQSIQLQQNDSLQRFMEQERESQLQNPLEQLYQGQIDTDDKKDVKMKTIRMQYITQKYKDRIYEQEFLKQVLFVKKQLLDIFLNTEQDILKREDCKLKIENQINIILQFWDNLQFYYSYRLKIFQQFQNLSSLDEIKNFLKKQNRNIKKIKATNKQLITKLIDKNNLKEQLYNEAQKYKDFQIFYQKNIKKLQKLNRILKVCQKLDKGFELNQLLSIDNTLEIDMWEIQYLEKLMIQQNVIKKIKNI